MHKLFVMLAIVISCFCLPPSSWGQAQITTGNIQGTITDEKGGAVPDAGVEAKNLDTNLAKTTTSGSDGVYQFLSLPPGRYTLTITKSGFSTTVLENAALTVGQTMSLPATMKLSSASDRIVVTATPDVIDTSSTSSSSTLDEISVSETPIRGRKFEDLLTLTPGVSVVQGPDGDEINFNGQRGIFNNISLDGGDYNNGFFGEQMGGQRAAIDITLDAVKEFQVVASGANAEFGRTAGGVVNVITKSGTNTVHGRLFEYQRLESLSSATSDGKPLDGFKREQFGGSLGGPIVKDKLFFFGTGEGVREDLNRANLSAPIGTACAVANPVFRSNITEAQISASPDCQRLVLLNFMKTTLNEDDSLPVSHRVRNAAVFGRSDYNLNAANQISASYNFDWSKNPNQTFDVPSYGTTANGIEGPSKIQAVNANWYSTISPTKLNEAHFTYSRETRPRSVISKSSVPDTGIGFAPSFRFGQPFFLEPGVDELFWHTDLRDDFSVSRGTHTFKFGGEWLHSLNTQVFRGFFTGRYLFDSPVGFLHYASPASLGPGFGPTAVECASGSYTSEALLTPALVANARPSAAKCPDGSAPTGGPLLFYLQHGPTQAGETVDQSGASSIANNEYSLFVQDTWKVTRNITLNYGLRWEAQIFPDPTLAPAKTAYGSNLSNPKFPSTGFLPNQKKMFQPRIGIAWDIRGNGKSAFRASYGIFNARQNMLTQVGAITTNGVQQQSIFSSSCVDSPKCDLFNTATFGAPPTYPNTTTIPLVAAGTFPFQPGITVFSKDYANPRIYAANAAYEQQIGKNMSAYADFDWSMGVHLTRFEDPNSALSGFAVPGTLNSDTVNYTGTAPFPNLGSITNTTSDARSLYRGVTFGVKEHLSTMLQLEGNYTYSQDWDDDSNERDPFTFRYANFYNLNAEYAPSDRDERHRFNFYTYAKLPAGFTGDVRMQAHSAQPITDATGPGTGPACSITNSNTRFVNGVDCGRNHLRKDNAFFSFDFALDRGFKLGERMKITPKLEIFNLFNNKNNVNPLSSPALFDFNGFLRVGVGDPRQAQLSARFEF
jgi:outer membrane receptor for ferrienterochelin and colicin